MIISSIGLVSPVNTHYSEESEDYQVGFPLDNAILPETSSFLVEPAGEGSELKMMVRIAKDRPATAISSKQGRHVSAYALMLEVIKERFNGAVASDIPDIVDELIAEYIDVKDKNFSVAQQEINDIKEKYLAETTSYQKRLAVYNADRATADFLSVGGLEEAMQSLDPEQYGEVQEAFARMRRAFAKREDVASIDIRNAMKRAKEGYSPLVDVLLRIAIITFNRTFDAAEDFPQPTKDEVKDAIGESVAIGRLRDKEKYLFEEDDKEYYDLENVAKDMAALFDYKYDLIKTKYDLKKGKDKKEMAQDCLNIVRRHIKMIHDAFPGIRDFLHNEEDGKTLLECFLDEFLEKEGWNKSKINVFKTSESLLEALVKNDNLLFDVDEKTCSMKYRSKVKKMQRGAVAKFNKSIGGKIPGSPFAGRSFFHSGLTDDEEIAAEKDFITLYREGKISDLLHHYDNALDECEEVKIADLTDEEISGSTLLNDERFLMTLYFLEKAGLNHQLSEDGNSVEILDDGEKVGMLALADISYIPSSIDHEESAEEKAERIGKLKKSRAEFFSDLLEGDKTIYVPIQIPGHFTLLAIDPESKTYRYVDSLKDHKIADFPVVEDDGVGYNPQKDLFDDLRAKLLEEGYSLVAGQEYKAQQFSADIREELIKRGEAELAQSFDEGNLTLEEMQKQISSLPEEVARISHNNECGFHVAAEIAIMAKERSIACAINPEEIEDELVVNPILAIAKYNPALESVKEFYHGRVLDDLSEASFVSEIGGSSHQSSPGTSPSAGSASSVSSTATSSYHDR